MASRKYRLRKWPGEAEFIFAIFADKNWRASILCVVEYYIILFMKQKNETEGKVLINIQPNKKITKFASNDVNLSFYLPEDYTISHLKSFLN